jgi:hypothetical protein
MTTQQNFLATTTDLKNLKDLGKLTNLDKSKIIRKALQHLLINELDH